MLPNMYASYQQAHMEEIAEYRTALHFAHQKLMLGVIKILASSLLEASAKCSFAMAKYQFSQEERIGT